MVLFFNSTGSIGLVFYRLDRFCNQNFRIFLIVFIISLFFLLASILFLIFLKRARRDNAVSQVDEITTSDPFAKTKPDFTSFTPQKEENYGAFVPLKQKDDLKRDYGEVSSLQKQKLIIEPVKSDNKDECVTSKVNLYDKPSHEVIEKPVDFSSSFFIQDEPSEEKKFLEVPSVKEKDIHKAELPKKEITSLSAKSIESKVIKKEFMSPEIASVRSEDNKTLTQKIEKPVLKEPLDIENSSKKIKVNLTKKEKDDSPPGLSRTRTVPLKGMKIEIPKKGQLDNKNKQSSPGDKKVGRIDLPKKNV